MRWTAGSSRTLGVHHLALNSRAAFGDDEPVNHQRLLERRKKTVAFFIPRGRKRFSDANG
jgi:succinylarginine dihydrolase